MGERDETQELPLPAEAKREYRRPEIVELGDVRDLVKGGDVEMPRPE